MRILLRNLNAWRPYFRLLPLILLLVLAVLLASGLFSKPVMEPRESRLIGYNIGAFAIPSLLDDSVISPATWKNKIVVVNFFASWCEGCLIEHPSLMKMSRSGKVEIIGIAWKDDSHNTVEWLQKHGNPYHQIGMDKNGDTTLAFGLSGTPETFIIDSNNKIAYNYKAPITEELADKVIIPMVEYLQAQHATAVNK